MLKTSVITFNSLIYTLEVYCLIHLVNYFSDIFFTIVNFYVVLFHIYLFLPHGSVCTGLKFLSNYSIRFTLGWGGLEGRLCCVQLSFPVVGLKVRYKLLFIRVVCCVPWVIYKGFQICLHWGTLWVLPVSEHVLCEFLA